MHYILTIFALIIGGIILFVNRPKWELSEIDILSIFKFKKKNNGNLEIDKKEPNKIETESITTGETQPIVTQILEEISYSDLEMKGACIKINGQYQPPCWFTPTEVEFNSFTSIANEVYRNYEMAGMIAELFRDENGLIMGVKTYKAIIVPYLNMERSIDNLLFYLNKEMKVGILECFEEKTQFPCLLEVKENSTYDQLAVKFYSNNKDSTVNRFMQANDIEYFYNNERDKHDLRPISEILKGTVVVLPKMP